MRSIVFIPLFLVCSVHSSSRRLRPLRRRGAPEKVEDFVTSVVHETTGSFEDKTLLHFVDCPIQNANSSSNDGITYSQLGKAGAKVYFNVPSLVNPTTNARHGGYIPNGMMKPGSFFPIGEHEIVVVAPEDLRSQNNPVCRFKISVVDAEPPMFVKCPVDREVILEGEKIALNYGTIEAVDNSNKEVLVKRLTGPVSGDELDRPGIYSIVYEAEDVHGNVSRCSFQMEVVKRDFGSTNQRPSAVSASPKSGIMKKVVGSRRENLPNLSRPLLKSDTTSNVEVSGLSSYFGDDKPMLPVDGLSVLARGSPVGSSLSSSATSEEENNNSIRRRRPPRFRQDEPAEAVVEGSNNDLMSSLITTEKEHQAQMAENDAERNKLSLKNDDSLMLSGGQTTDPECTSFRCKLRKSTSDLVQTATALSAQQLANEQAGTATIPPQAHEVDPLTTTVHGLMALMNHAMGLGEGRRLQQANDTTQEMKEAVRNGARDWSSAAANLMTPYVAPWVNLFMDFVPETDTNEEYVQKYEHSPELEEHLRLQLDKQKQSTSLTQKASETPAASAASLLRSFPDPDKSNSPVNKLTAVEAQTEDQIDPMPEDLPSIQLSDHSTPPQQKVDIYADYLHHLQSFHEKKVKSKESPSVDSPSLAIPNSENEADIYEMMQISRPAPNGGSSGATPASTLQRLDEHDARMARLNRLDKLIRAKPLSPETARKEVGMKQMLATPNVDSTLTGMNHSDDVESPSKTPYQINNHSMTVPRPDLVLSDVKVNSSLARGDARRRDRMFEFAKSAFNEMLREPEESSKWVAEKNTFEDSLKHVVPFVKEVVGAVKTLSSS